MKTIAVVDEGRASQAYYADYFARIRRETGAESVVVITDGDFSREAGLSGKDKYARTQAFLAAGADGVVEMPLFSVLLPDNVYAFSVTAMLQKLGCLDGVAIPFVGESELFEKIGWFLFDEPAAYQKRMRALRSQGVELDTVLPGVLEEFVPGAGEFLRRRMNRMAVEYYNTLRRAYFPVKPYMIRLDEAPASEPVDTAVQDAYLLACVRERFAQKETVAWAKDMFSGSEKTAQRTLEALKAPETASFAELSRRVAYEGVHAVAVRRHLLGCLIGYRKVDSFVCIIYNYIPYIRVLGGVGEFQTRLLEKAGTTVLIDTAQQRDFSRMDDNAKEMLARIEDCARALYNAAR